MKQDKTLKITTVICLIPLIFSVALYYRLPDLMAIHFNYDGNQDNYVPKAVGAFGLLI